MNRLARLIEAIDRITAEYAYYDDTVDDIVIDLTEEETYDLIMKDNELHLLGAEQVKHWISLWYTDWQAYEAWVLASRKAGII